MTRMMGRSKHWGRWFIDSREGNRAARTQEKRATAAESAYGIIDWSEDQDDALDATDPHHGPGSGTP